MDLAFTHAASTSTGNTGPGIHACRQYAHRYSLHSSGPGAKKRGNPVTEASTVHIFQLLRISQNHSIRTTCDQFLDEIIAFRVHNQEQEALSFIGSMGNFSVDCVHLSTSE